MLLLVGESPGDGIAATLEYARSVGMPLAIDASVLYGTSMAGLDCAEVSAAAWPSLRAGIHGTDATYSLGTAASHGCIRMAIPDVIELYDEVPVSAPVYIA